MSTLLSKLVASLFDAMEPQLKTFLDEADSSLDYVEIKLGLRRRNDPKARVVGTNLRTSISLDLLTAKDREKAAIEAEKRPTPIDSYVIRDAIEARLREYEIAGYLPAPPLVEVDYDGKNAFVVRFKGDLGEIARGEPSILGLPPPEKKDPAS